MTIQLGIKLILYCSDLSVSQMCFVDLFRVWEASLKGMHWHFDTISSSIFFSIYIIYYTSQLLVTSIVCRIKESQVIFKTWALDISCVFILYKICHNFPGHTSVLERQSIIANTFELHWLIQMSEKRLDGLCIKKLFLMLNYSLVWFASTQITTTNVGILFSNHILFYNLKYML